MEKKTYKSSNLRLKQIKNPDLLYDEVRTYIRDKEVLDWIKSAYHFAAEKHEGQKRKNDDPYIYHPLTTAYFLAQLKMSPTTIVAGLLHDIIEDTPIRAEDLEKKFGQEVAELVESVTKVSYFAKENRAEIKADYLRKLYLSMAKDIRVMIIKICDRLHNMLTINYLPIEKQKVIANETLHIYSTIAHRLGMKNAKSALEDMSFKVLQPKEYDKIVALIEKGKSERNYEINKTIGDLDYYLKKEHQIDNIAIFGRDKTIYSIYRKINMFGYSFDDINDLYAIRIIANSIPECYEILGLIHQKYIPISNRFKDYIATPKNNLYQSLHTTLTTTKGMIFEIQIRTEEMDEIAESGAAAHWKYKENEVFDPRRKQAEIDEKLDIFKRILQLRDDEEENPEELTRELQEDIFTSSIYVLTPNGKVITLPYGSTVLDFAYRIHTELGQTTIGAKVNGLFVPINTVLNSGEVVEIKTSSTQHPKHEWLKIVTTSAARNRIRKYLSNNVINDVNNLSKKEENKLIIDRVKNNLNAYINSRDLRWKKRNDKEALELAKKDGFQSLDEVYLDINKDDLSFEKACELYFLDMGYSKDDEIKLLLEKKNDDWSQPDSKNDFIIEGINNIKMEISNCCLPIPYEEIVGYVTKGKGIKVHLVNCENVRDPEIQKRLVTVHWNNATTKDKHYIAKLSFFGIERPNLLYDVTKVLTSLQASIINANVNVDEKRLQAMGVLKIKIHNSDQLSNIVSSLKAVPGIDEVERVNSINNSAK